MAFYVRFPGRKPKTKPPAVHALSGEKVAPPPTGSTWHHRTLCGRTVERDFDHVERRFARSKVEYVTCAACRKAVAGLPGPFVVRVYRAWDDVPRFVCDRDGAFSDSAYEPKFATSFVSEELAEAYAAEFRRRDGVTSATIEVLSDGPGAPR